MALRRIDGPKAMEAMRVALVDRSEQLCLQAVKGLGELRDAEAVETLIKVLARRERSLVTAATEALSRIGHDAVPHLMEACKDRYLQRRIGPQIWRILTEMGPRVVDPLVAVLGDDNYYVRLTALTILGRTGDKRVVEPILRVFLSDPRLQETVGERSAASRNSSLTLLELGTYIRSGGELVARSRRPHGAHVSHERNVRAA